MKALPPIDSRNFVLVQVALVEFRHRRAAQSVMQVPGFVQANVAWQTMLCAEMHRKDHRSTGGPYGAGPLVAGFMAGSLLASLDAAIMALSKRRLRG